MPRAVRQGRREQLEPRPVRKRAVTREPGPVKGGNTVIAFVTDPDGYKIELIERRFDGAGGGL